MYIYKGIINSNMLNRIDNEASGKPLRSFYELFSFLNIIILYHIYEIIVLLKSYKFIL